jgi:hypothetical protein
MKVDNILSLVSSDFFLLFMKTSGGQACELLVQVGHGVE